MPEPDVVFQLVFALELGVAVNAFERPLVTVARRQVASQVLALVEQLAADVTLVTSTAVVDETVTAEHPLVDERGSALDLTIPALLMPGRIMYQCETRVRQTTTRLF